MAFFKKPLIDCVDWNPQGTNVFAYRFPETNLSTYTQLIVRESQEAVLFSKGQIMGKFGAGKHTLSTENLPLLRSLFGLPFGGKNPFTAEVWFVNKTVPLDIEWKTDGMKILDPDYGQSIPIFAEGRYGLRIIDAERFLIQLVGTLTSFTAANLTNHFRGKLVSKTKSAIASFVAANNAGINYISGHLSDLSEFIQQPLSEFWEGYGFTLEGFFITTVDVDTSTELGRKIEQAIASRSAQGIAGYTWQQEQAAEVAKNAVSNGTGMGGMMAAAMFMGNNGGSAMGMGSMLMQPRYGTMQGQMQQDMYSQQMPQQGYGQAARRVREVFCAKCGRKHSVDEMFCPNCGKKYIPCPACGADNFENSKRCVKCNTYLSRENEDMLKCPRCGEPYTPGRKFCPKCGNKLE